MKNRIGTIVVDRKEDLIKGLRHQVGPLEGEEREVICQARHQAPCTFSGGGSWNHHPIS